MSKETSNKLSKDLTELEVNVMNLYSKIIGMNNIIDFTLKHSNGTTLTNRINDLQETGNLGSLPIIEMRSESTGNVFSVYVAHITNDVIICIQEDNEMIRMEDRFRNISSIHDKLVIINEIEDELENEDEIDLFEHYQTLPQEVQDIIENFDADNPSIAVDELERKLTPLGYEFEYGLSYEPYNLRKIKTD